MTIIDLLALGMFVTLAVNWVTVTVIGVTERRHPDIKTLTDRRWVSLGIAALSTALSLLAVSYLTRQSFGPVVNVLLLTVPTYALTLVNVAFLWLTWKGRW